MRGTFFYYNISMWIFSHLYVSFFTESSCMQCKHISKQSAIVCMYIYSIYKDIHYIYGEKIYLHLSHLKKNTSSTNSLNSFLLNNRIIDLPVIVAHVVSPAFLGNMSSPWAPPAIGPYLIRYPSMVDRLFFHSSVMLLSVWSTALRSVGASKPETHRNPSPHH